MGAAELLGPAGPFAKTLSSYEPRTSQQQMAAAVERALTGEGVALIEAGTGTGKTLAYLVPALLAAGRAKKIVISTATRALQDQIFHQDLPLARRVLGTNTQVALMKGLPNYVCRRRQREFASSAESMSPAWSRSLPLVEAWQRETTSGAIEELASVAEDDPIWGRITASSERRIGAGCPFFDDCYVTAMKREAMRADIVVVNHHLFFADLALRGGHPSNVLPDYDAVIFDEAHQLADIATEYFGQSVSSARVARLVNDAARALEREWGARSGPAARVAELGEALFDTLGRAVKMQDGRAPLPPEVWGGEVEERWFALDTALEGLSGLLDVQAEAERQRDAAGPSDGGNPPNLAALVRRASAVRDDLAAIAHGVPGRVIWFESGPRSRKVSASPVELAELFQTRLFDVTPSVVLTSATLANAAERSAAAAPPPSLDPSDLDPAAPEEPERSASTSERRVAGPFGFQRQRLGLVDERYRIEELVVRSPFHFEEQALLYLPDDLPLPEAQEFPAAMAERTRQLIAQCDGGAFALTTSLRAMHALERALAGQLEGRPLFVQGEAPKARLLERFRAAGNGVLVATASFWQGVDIPGAALRLVVLEKAPFPVPTDPILLARARAIEEAGESPFVRLHLPLAQLALKQGFGRLIRSRSDYGVVALLDARVHRRGYGRRLLEGLPPARRVTGLADVAEFWARFRGAQA